jgi:hypothetical protein
LSRIKKTDVQLYKDETGRDSVRGAFGIPSGFLYTSFGSSSGAPEGFREDSRRISEENNKKTGNRDEKYLFHRASACTLQFRFYSTPFLRSTELPASEMIGCEE